MTDGHRDDDAVVALLRRVDPAGAVPTATIDHAWNDFLSAARDERATSESQSRPVPSTVLGGVERLTPGAAPTGVGWPSRLAFLGAAAVLVVVVLATIGVATRSSPDRPPTAPVDSIVTASSMPVSTATTSTVAPGQGLTPLRSTLPVIAPDRELEVQAEAVDPSRRQMWGADVPGGVGWAFPDRRGNAFPIMSLDNKVVGIYVFGLGIITRAQYEDSNVDLEALARQRLGDEQYFKILSHTQNPPMSFDLEADVVARLARAGRDFHVDHETIPRMSKAEALAKVQSEFAVGEHVLFDAGFGQYSRPRVAKGAPAGVDAGPAVDAPINAWVVLVPNAQPPGGPIVGPSDGPLGQSRIMFVVIDDATGNIVESTTGG